MYCASHTEKCQFCSENWISQVSQKWAEMPLAFPALLELLILLNAHPQTLPCALITINILNVKARMGLGAAWDGKKCPCPWQGVALSGL